jgi:hypothetical protein
MTMSGSGRNSLRGPIIEPPTLHRNNGRKPRFQARAPAAARQPAAAPVQPSKRRVVLPPVP